MRPAASSIVATALSLLALPALGQDANDTRAVMNVDNDRPTPVSMRVAYYFMDYSWTLIEKSLEPGGGVTYRYPSNLPGCSYLNDSGLDSGRVEFSTESGALCSIDFSICKTRTYNIRLTPIGCQVVGEDGLSRT